MIRLYDNRTERGWLIESNSDIFQALLEDPAFKGIGEEFIAEALEELHNGPFIEFETVRDLSEYVLKRFF